LKTLDISHFLNPKQAILKNWIEIVKPNDDNFNSAVTRQPSVEVLRILSITKNYSCF